MRKYLFVEEGNENFDIILEKIIKGRKSEKTREYVELIISALREGVDRSHGYKAYREWRKRDLYKKLVSSGQIPNQVTFFRLLDTLVEEGLVRPRKDVGYKGKGPKPTYYTLNGSVDEFALMDPKELRELVRKYDESVFNLVRDLNIALRLVEEYYRERDIEIDAHETIDSIYMAIWDCLEKHGYDAIDPPNNLVFSDEVEHEIENIFKDKTNMVKGKTTRWAFTETGAAMVMYIDDLCSSSDILSIPKKYRLREPKEPN